MLSLKRRKTRTGRPGARDVGTDTPGDTGSNTPVLSTNTESNAESNTESNVVTSPKNGITLPVDIEYSGSSESIFETHSRSKSSSQAEKFMTLKAFRKHGNSSLSNTFTETLSFPVTPESTLPRVNGLLYLPGTVLPVQSRFYQNSTYAAPVDNSNDNSSTINATESNISSSNWSARGSTFAPPIFFNATLCNTVLPDPVGCIKLEVNSQYYLCSPRCQTCNAVSEECWCGDEEPASDNVSSNNHNVVSPSTPSIKDIPSDKKNIDYGTIKRQNNTSTSSTLGRATLSRKLSYSLGTSSLTGIASGTIPIGANSQIAVLTASSLLANPIGGNLVLNDPYGHYYLNHFSIPSLPQVVSNTSITPSSRKNRANYSFTNGATYDELANDTTSHQRSESEKKANDSPNISSSSISRKTTVISSVPAGTTLADIKSEALLSDIVRLIRKQALSSNELSKSDLSNSGLNVVGASTTVVNGKAVKRISKQKSTSVGHINASLSKETSSQSLRISESLHHGSDSSCINGSNHIAQISSNAIEFSNKLLGEEDDFVCSLPRRNELSSVSGTPVLEYDNMRESESSINSAPEVTPSPSMKSENSTPSKGKHEKHKVLVASSISSQGNSAAYINLNSEQKVYITSSGGLSRKYSITGTVPSQETIPELPLKNSSVLVNYSKLNESVKEWFLVSNADGQSPRESMQSGQNNDGIKVKDLSSETIYRNQHIVLLDYILSFFEEDSSFDSTPRLILEIPTEKCIAFIHTPASMKQRSVSGYKLNNFNKMTDEIEVYDDQFSFLNIIYEGGHITLAFKDNNEAEQWAAYINTAASNISFAVSMTSRLSHEAEYYKEFYTMTATTVRDIRANDRFLELKRNVDKELKSIKDQSTIGIPETKVKGRLDIIIKDKSKSKKAKKATASGSSTTANSASNSHISLLDINTPKDSSNGILTPSDATLSEGSTPNEKLEKEQQTSYIPPTPITPAAPSVASISKDSRKSVGQDPVYVLDSNVVLPHLQHLQNLQRQDTIHAKIEYLTGIPSPRPSQMLTFMQTYRSFTTTEEIISHLRARLHLKPPRADATPEQLAFVCKFQPLIRLRVLKFIIDWLSPNIGSFGIVPSRDTWSSLQEFLQYIIETCNDNELASLSGSPLSSYSSFTRSGSIAENSGSSNNVSNNNAGTKEPSSKRSSKQYSGVMPRLALSNNTHGDEIRTIALLLEILIYTRKQAIQEKLADWEREERDLTSKLNSQTKNKDKVFSLEVLERLNERGGLLLSDSPNQTSPTIKPQKEISLKYLKSDNFSLGPTNVISSAANVLAKFQFASVPEIDMKSLAVAITTLDMNRLVRITSQGIIFPFTIKKTNDRVVKRLNKVIDEMVTAFNNTSHWVATEVCTQPQMKPRAKVIEKMIKLAKELKLMDNYNSCLAIISGLNMASVSRLRQTWAAIDPHRLKQMQQIEQFFTPTQNYKTYRNYVANLPAGSYIPILSIILKDIYFLTDANQKTPSVGRSLVKAIRNSGVLPRFSVNTMSTSVIQSTYALSSLTIGYSSGGFGGFNVDYFGSNQNYNKNDKIYSPQYFSQQQKTYLQSTFSIGLPILLQGYASPLAYSPGFLDSSKTWKYTGEGITELLGFSDSTNAILPNSVAFVKETRPFIAFAPDPDFLYGGKVRYLESNDALWKYSSLCEKSNSSAPVALSAAAAAVADAQRAALLTVDTNNISSDNDNIDNSPVESLQNIEQNNEKPDIEQTLELNSNNIQNNIDNVDLPITSTISSE